MTKQEFVYKSKAYMHRKLILSRRNKPYYNYLYSSFWHMKLCSYSSKKDVRQYLAARPNPGAGVGHQIANWLSGLKIADMLLLKYATYPFSYLSDPFVPNEWDDFLGLNKNEVRVLDLLKQDYRTILLPLFDVQNQSNVDIIQKIIDSYRGKKVVFLLEMDEFAGNELDYLTFMRDKYQKTDKSQWNLEYSSNHYNVAVHIRRGDIVQSEGDQNEGLKRRWLDNEYYLSVLDRFFLSFNPGKPVHLYIFTQGTEEELSGYDRFGTIHFCNKMSAIESFYHMANADLFVMSKSGMSYQAAKLNENGIIICPSDFWREPVESERWIVDKEVGLRTPDGETS